MNQNRGVRFLPMVVILLIVIVIIAVIVSVGRSLLGGGQDNREEATDTVRTALLDTSGTNSVAMVVRGPIVANEEFRSYKITVSPTIRDLSVYSGYLDRRTDGDRLDNNKSAYEQFVYALDKAQMTRMRNVEEPDDLRGICASGYVYDFRILQNDKTLVEHMWTSTCDGSKGTLAASKDQLANLFIEQIPNAGELIPFESSLRMTY